MPSDTEHTLRPRPIVVWICPACDQRRLYATRQCGACSRSGLSIVPVAYEATKLRRRELLTGRVGLKPLTGAHRYMEAHSA